MQHRASAATAIDPPASARLIVNHIRPTTALVKRAASETSADVIASSSAFTTAQPGANKRSRSSSREIRFANSLSCAKATQHRPTLTTSSAPRSTSPSTTAIDSPSTIATTSAASATRATAARQCSKSAGSGKSRSARPARPAARFRRYSQGHEFSKKIVFLDPRSNRGGGQNLWRRRGADRNAATHTFSQQKNFSVLNRF